MSEKISKNRRKSFNMTPLGKETNQEKTIPIRHRKRKGLVGKSISEEFSERDYDSNEMSSKWDIKPRSQLDSLLIDEKT